MDLVKISRSVNETFGLQVLLSMALASVFITGLLYYSYTVIYLTTNPGIDTRPGLISASCWLFFYVMKILIVNHICDRTSAEVFLYFIKNKIHNNIFNPKIKKYFILVIFRLWELEILFANCMNRWLIKNFAQRYSLLSIIMIYHYICSYACNFINNQLYWIEFQIREFLLQLIQNPLKFTAYDFVTLDYTFIQGVSNNFCNHYIRTMNV